jgi:hypothetical protein
MAGLIRCFGRAASHRDRLFSVAFYHVFLGI